ncbi:hypothetical protein ABQE57_07995 [Mycolicibacterium elephantis]
MTLDNDYDKFVKLNPATCRALALNADMPLRFRVAFMAYGSVRRNGHACFKPGELAQILGVRPDSLSRGIAKAKASGLLMYESSARCLVVPEHVVKGWLGHENDPCAVHHGKRSRGQKLAIIAKK